MANPPSVLSETGRLRKVVIHSPGPEWDLVPCGPGALRTYLIEDIFVLSRAQEEHDCFVKILKLFIGDENVLEIADLLAEVCRKQKTRLEIIGAVTANQSLGIRIVDELSKLPPRELADVMIRGAEIDETDRQTYENIFPPLPNLLFTRDIGIAIPRGFILAHAATSARRRETLLMRYILRHPIFKGVNCLDILNYQNAIFWNNHKSGEAVSIEGGDILVLKGDTLFIGTGERTTEKGFLLLLDALEKNKSPIMNVIRTIIPKERASMHLDTVVTITGDQELIVYGSVIHEAQCEIYKRPFKEKNKRATTFLGALLEINWPEAQIFECGGTCEVFRSREQWTDGANLFAIGPGVLLGYDRNVETARALEKKYKYLEPRGSDLKEIEKAAKQFRENGRVDQNILIGLPGSELSRARGGPRCMTMPLYRDAVQRWAD